jgi:hypothetical protein
VLHEIKTLIKCRSINLKYLCTLPKETFSYYSENNNLPCGIFSFCNMLVSKYGHSSFLPIYCCSPSYVPNLHSQAPMCLCLSYVSVAYVSVLTDMDDMDDGISARPRRLSEFNMATKTQPIPPASSFFIFSKSNR